MSLHGSKIEIYVLPTFLFWSNLFVGGIKYIKVFSSTLPWEIKIKLCFWSTMICVFLKKTEEYLNLFFKLMRQIGLIGWQLKCIIFSSNLCLHSECIISSYCGIYWHPLSGRERLVMAKECQDSGDNLSQGRTCGNSRWSCSLRISGFCFCTSQPSWALLPAGAWWVLVVLTFPWNCKCYME